MEAAIETHGLSKSFGDVHALRDLDLTVEAGTVLGLLGPPRRPPNRSGSS